jgi:hypothetical protein
MACDGKSSQSQKYGTECHSKPISGLFGDAWFTTQIWNFGPSYNTLGNGLPDMGGDTSILRIKILSLLLRSIELKTIYVYDGIWLAKGYSEKRAN